MEYLIVEQPLFDVEGVADILREADLTCVPAGLEANEFDPYFLAHYRAQEELHACKGFLLLDLNVLRRVNSLHPIAGIEIGKQERVAAALMAFCTYANVVMDPGLAVMEWFNPRQADKRRRQIELFRQLDNTDPTLFASIALGVADSIPASQVGRARSHTVKAMTEFPTGWHFDYTAMLKVAVLTLEGEQAKLPRIDLMEQFLNWCWGEFLFSAPAINFGSLYLSPSRKGRMFKSLRSGKPERALAGVRNATWDLAYLREWGRRAQQQSGAHFHFFCSLDRALRESGREFVMLQEAEHAPILGGMQKRLWGERDGQRVMETYLSLASQQSDPRRNWKAENTSQDAEGLIQVLEQELTRLVQAQ